jgi:polyphosphate kinase
MMSAPDAGPPRYFNREISWLEFNKRVLEEAMDPSHPLLERAKFLSIVHSNLDEFFMIRVSGLQEQVESGFAEPSRDGLTPEEQLSIIRERVSAMRHEAWTHFRDELRPQLAAAGIHLLTMDVLDDSRRKTLSEYYGTVVYPVLTPLAVDPAHPFPHISNLSLSLAVVVRDKKGTERFARVKVPQVLPRLVPVEPPAGGGRRRRKAEYAFVWLEDLIAVHLPALFRGLEVVRSYPFRVIRDADFEIREDEAGDLLQTIERKLMRRRFGSVSQLEISSDMPDEIEDLLVRNLQIDSRDAYRCEGVLGLSCLMDLMGCDRPDLKDKPLRPRVPRALRNDIFRAIRERNILVHHPFDSFGPVVELVQTAARDPDVLAIKQTIYRVGSNSPVVAALKDASDNGKQVSVMVELKARFDEENNIEWARVLEAAGVHVVYGDVDLKTHCKVLMVVRKEGDGIRRYIHLGTGNYNAKTALLYTDFGMFTCDPVIADDVTALFNALTGYVADQSYTKLLVSPRGIRKGIVERIRREMAHAAAGRRARIIFKMNSLTDFDCADVLYEASQAGVGIDLIVRGSCCLVPGVPGMSDNIRVRSIVGRFLEHDRVYYFLNGGREEVWLGSADLMPRNLDRRVETLFPVEDPEHVHWLVGTFLSAYLADNCKARVLQSDGTYVRADDAGGDRMCAQDWFIGHGCDGNDGADG